MSKKWRSSKKLAVNGDAFRDERRKFKSRDQYVKRGEYGKGSQEWLADTAKVSPRTINELETGRATLRTVDSVSDVLGIKGRKYILGYGEEFTTIEAPGVVDFRSMRNGRLEEYKTAYLEEAFFVTLLPIRITVDDNFIDEVQLDKMTLNLSVGELNLDFSWIYNVQLNSRATTWLGDEKDVQTVFIRTREPYQESVMFRQDSFDAVSWKTFINHVKTTEDSRILLTVTLFFKYFQKQDHILVSVEEMKGLFDWAYPNGKPYWIEPKALMI